MGRHCGSCKQPLPELDTELWTLELGTEPPTQNKVSGNKGGIKARKAYTKLRDDYAFVLRAWMNELGIPDATGRRRVYITRLYTGRGQKRDRGNLIGGCKPLLDAMTRCGLIVDDKEEFLEDHYEQERGTKKGCRIEVEEMA